MPVLTVSLCFRSHANGQAEARFEGYVPEWGDLEQQSGTKNITYEDEIELVGEKCSFYILVKSFPLRCGKREAVD